MVGKDGEWVLKGRQKISSIFQMVLKKRLLMKPLMEILARLGDRRDDTVSNTRW